MRSCTVNNSEIRILAMRWRLNSRERNQEVGKRPERVSLRLLPFGPDRVGESFARTNLSQRNLVRPARIGKIACHDTLHNSVDLSRKANPDGRIRTEAPDS